ncbi:MAG: L-fucose/L-arabinose isomerase family protein [Nitrososphaerota archaeon]
MKNFKVGLIVTGEEVLDTSYGLNIAEKVCKLLKEDGINIFKIDEIVTNFSKAREIEERIRENKIDTLIILLGTFTEDPVTLTLANSIEGPIILWAIPEPKIYEELEKEVSSGSLVGAMMNASALKKVGKKFIFIYGEVEKVLESLKKAIKILYTLKNLKFSRIGLIGSHAPGFYDGSFDEVLLKKTIGIEVVHVDLSILRKYMENISDEEAKTFSEKTFVEDIDSSKIPIEDIIKETKIFLALKKIIEEYSLNAITLKCWPEINFSGCLSLSLLSENGIPSGCEGDVNAAATMLILKYLTNKPSYFCDIFHINKDKNTLLTYHCGAAAISLGEKNYRKVLRKHPLGDGITIEFPINEGIVTIARLGNINGKYRLFITKGEAIKTNQIVRGNPAEIKIPYNVEDFLNKLIYKGIEHHYLIVHGDFAEEIEQLCNLMDIEIISIE